MRLFLQPTFFKGKPLTHTDSGEVHPEQCHIAFPDLPKQHEVSSAPTCARFPLITRTSRPSNLQLTRTNGLTTIPLDELRQCISGNPTSICATLTQVSPTRSERLPKTTLGMGNKLSSLNGPPRRDNSSERSVVRKPVPVRVLRKSSTNLLKRNDSKSPLPQNISGTVVRVSQQVSQSTFDDSSEEDDDIPADHSPDGHQSPGSPEDKIPIHSASTVTITNDNALRPLSASTTIRESTVEHRDPKADNRSPYRGTQIEPDTDFKHLPPEPPNRHSALSPSIPAPSPLPEDSPHKYGLKDRTDTPDMPDPEDINVVKARRRSSGLDIFNVGVHWYSCHVSWRI